MGISAVVGFAVVLAAAVLLWRLGSVGMGTTGEETEVVHSCWGQDRRSCQIFSLKPLPLTAIKIVVTVWQIVYQVCVRLYFHEPFHDRVDEINHFSRIHSGDFFV